MAEGFRICADGIGDSDVPLRVLADLAPDLVKLDASLLTRPALVRAMRTLCEQLGALLSVEGVETELQCPAALSAGAQPAQGELFAPPARRPAADVYVPVLAPATATTPPYGPPVRQFVRPAALLPATASAGQVRALLAGSPAVSGVVLVDSAGVLVRSVHRSRFLLSMSGRYGHALYADRPAARLGDPPRTVGVDAPRGRFSTWWRTGRVTVRRTMSRSSTGWGGAWASSCPAQAGREVPPRGELGAGPCGPAGPRDPARLGHGTGAGRELGELNVNPAGQR